MGSHYFITVVEKNIAIYYACIVIILYFCYASIINVKNKDYLKPEETIDYHIQTAWHGISRMYNQIATQYGVSRAIGYVLLNIDDNGTPATKIAPLLGMEPTSLSRMLKNMEERGLIYRRGDDLDKRKVLIFLTEEGLRMRRLTRKVVKGFNDKLFQNVDAQTFNCLVKISNNINSSLEDYKQEAILTLDKINE